MNKRELYGEDEIIGLSFDDGDSFECGIMGTFEVDGVMYIALDCLEDEDVYLYRYVETGDEFELEDIPEEDFDRVAEKFDNLMNEEG